MNIYFDTFISHYDHKKLITGQTKEEIYKHLSILKLKKKHKLIKENERHDFAYFVIKGAARSYYLKDGVEINTWFAFENDLVASLYNFRDLPSRETFVLLENATLISVNMKMLKSLIYQNIQISNFISAIIEEYAVFLEERLFYSQFVTAKDRYAALLEQEPAVLKRIPLTYIASYLGISRETLSRIRGN